MKPPETWIRLESHGKRKAVCVWVRLKGEKTLLINQDGTYSIRHDWSGYLFNTRTVEESEAKGIVRIS